MSELLDCGRMRMPRTPAAGHGQAAPYQIVEGWWKCMMCNTYVSEGHLMTPKHIERTGWYIDGWDPKTPEWQLHGRHGWVPQAALHGGELPQAAWPPYPVPPPVPWPNSVPKAAAPPPPPVSDMATGTVFDPPPGPSEGPPPAPWDLLTVRTTAAASEGPPPAPWRPTELLQRLEKIEEKLNKLGDKIDLIAAVLEGWQLHWLPSSSAASSDVPWL